MGGSNPFVTLGVQRIDKFAVQMGRWAFGLSFVEPSVTGIKGPCYGKIVNLQHFLGNTVRIIKGPANTTMRINEGIIVGDAVYLGKSQVGDICDV